MFKNIIWWFVNFPVSLYYTRKEVEEVEKFFNEIYKPENIRVVGRTLVRVLDKEDVKRLNKERESGRHARLCSEYRKDGHHKSDKRVRMKSIK